MKYWKHKSSLPNQEGFKFIARTVNGLVEGEVVVYGPYKLHTTSGVNFKDILEWTEL